MSRNSVAIDIFTEVCMIGMYKSMHAAVICIELTGYLGSLRKSEGKNKKSTYVCVATVCPFGVSCLC